MNITDITEDQVIQAYIETGLTPGAGIQNCALGALVRSMGENPRSTGRAAFHLGLNKTCANNFGYGFDSEFGDELTAIPLYPKSYLLGVKIAKAVKAYFKLSSSVSSQEASTPSKPDPIPSTVNQ